MITPLKRKSDSEIIPDRKEAEILAYATNSSLRRGFTTHYADGLTWIVVGKEIIFRWCLR